MPEIRKYESVVQRHRGKTIQVAIIGSSKGRVWRVRSQGMSVITQIISELRQTANGAAVLNDWLGDGGLPVPMPQAEARSFICKTCPLNVAPGWWHKFFLDPIAKAIRKTISIKNQIGLVLSCEEELHMCKACGCAPKLKVHVPIEHIKAHHKPEHKYDPRCWVTKEMEQS